MKRAINETSGKEARKVLGKLLPLLGTAGAKVPGSSSKQHSDLSMLYAYSQFFDLPSMFITVSFDDTGNRLLLRFAMSGSPTRSTVACMAAPHTLRPHGPSIEGIFSTLE